jgi:hypothetical protein
MHAVRTRVTEGLAWASLVRSRISHAEAKEFVRVAPGAPLVRARSVEFVDRCGSQHHTQPEFLASPMMRRGRGPEYGHECCGWPHAIAVLRAVVNDVAGTHRFRSPFSTGRPSSVVAA